MTEVLTFDKFGTIVKIPKSTPSHNWFTIIYHKWETETFQAIDRLLDPTKYFLDIGAWIGPLSVYAGQKCKGVICVDADREALLDLKANLAANNVNIAYIYEQPIDSIHRRVKFGANQFGLGENKLNKSISQIQREDLPEAYSYPIETITYTDILKRFPKSQIGLIKIDIEGGEETILEDTLRLAQDIPVLISFHCLWWKDRNHLEILDRLVQELNLIATDYKGNLILDPKTYIKNSPFGSLAIGTQKNLNFESIEKTISSR